MQVCGCLIGNPCSSVFDQLICNIAKPSVICRAKPLEEARELDVVAGQGFELRVGFDHGAKTDSIEGPIFLTRLTQR